MANRCGITSIGKKKPKNTQRQQKIDKAVQRYEASLLSQVHKYERGEEVDTVTDSLGNKYIYIEIGDNRINNAKIPIGQKTTWNSKTNAIYTQLYERMKKHGFVLCQKGLHDCERAWVQAWLLVEHNENPPEEETKNTITKQAEAVYNDLFDIVPQYTEGSLEGEVDQFVREQAMKFMREKLKKKT